MYRAERQTHRRDARQHPGGNGDKRQNQHAWRAKKPQQQCGDHDYGDNRQSLGITAYCVASFDGEYAGACHQQAELRRAGFFFDRREMGTNIAQYDFLRVDVKTRRFGLCHQQRAIAVARKPYAVTLGRPALSLELFDEMNKFARGIFRQHALHQHAQRRIKHVEIIVHGLAQRGLGEARGRDGVAQYVAMIQQKITFGAHAGFVAIVAVGQGRVRHESLEQSTARRGAVRFATAFNRQQQHARDGPILQLINQNFLRFARLTRQKRADIAIEYGVADHHKTCGAEQQPDR